MSGNDQSKERPGGSGIPDDEGRSRLSRRSVLGAAGAGAAGLAAGAFGGLAAAGPAVAATRPASGARGDRGEGHDSDEQVVVHVRDASSGEIDVFRGTSHVRVHDRELAARLMRASH